MIRIDLQITIRRCPRCCKFHLLRPVLSTVTNILHLICYDFKVKKGHFRSCCKWFLFQSFLVNCCKKAPANFWRFHHKNFFPFMRPKLMCHEKMEILLRLVACRNSNSLEKVLTYFVPNLFWLFSILPRQSKN